jgi:hypothetical protein
MQGSDPTIIELKSRYRSRQRRRLRRRVVLPLLFFAAALVLTRAGIKGVEHMPDDLWVRMSPIYLAIILSTGLGGPLAGLVASAAGLLTWIVSSAVWFAAHRVEGAGWFWTHAVYLTLAITLFAIHLKYKRSVLQ